MTLHSKELNSDDPVNKFAEYIILRMEEFGWNLEKCAQNSNISQGEISKIKSKIRKNVSAKSFYLIYKAFGDSCQTATKFVYPDLKLNLFKYEISKRNVFGNFMIQFEKEIDENSPDIIAQKTKISTQRVNELYFKKGALHAYELLLIEHAVGKKQGELFEAFYGRKLGDY